MIFLLSYLLITTSFTTGQITFGPPTSYTTGMDPWSIFASDLNGDGIKDLVTGNNHPAEVNDISVFINTGDATFYPAVNYSINLLSRTTSVFASDLDWDGDKDLAVANDFIFWAGNVSILPNSGNGTFQVIGRDYTVGWWPYSIFAADIDGDFDNDLVTANNADTELNDISILMNHGDGIFNSAVNYGLDLLSCPLSIFVSDLNGDSYKDLVTANFITNDISILPNNGDGSFQVGLNYSFYDAPSCVIASDLDNNGGNDLAVAIPAAGNGSIAILINDDNGLFNQPVFYNTGNDYAPTYIVASDLDGDGDNDLVTSNSVSNIGDNISIFSNNGDGTFQAVGGYQFGNNSTDKAIIASDLDMDGDNDLAVVNSTFNNGSGTVKVLLNLSNPDIGAISGTIKNINGAILSDAQVKIFVTDDFGEYTEFAIDTTNADGQYFVDSLFPGRYSLEVYRNGYYKQTKYGIVPEGGVGTRNFTLELAGFIHDSDYVAGDRPQSVFSADLDDDGDNDLAVANYNSDNVSILLNSGDGKYQEAVNYEVGNEPASVFSADLDGDNDEDLAIANYNSNNISILFNNGNGTFQTPMNYGVGSGPSSVFASDLDGDGDNDLAATNYNSNTFSILENLGDGTFQFAANYTVGYYPTSVYACDFDGDEDNDLSVSIGYDDKVAILKNNGDGTFQSPVNYAVGHVPFSVFASDLENDGDMDIAVVNASSDNVSILKNNGDGTFLPKVNYYAGEGPISVFASDFDGDGYYDLAVATISNPITDSISILLNNGNGTFQIPVRYIVGQGSCSVFATDLDDDGDMDIAATNGSSDNISILLNQSIITGVENTPVFIFPESFNISQNYPNPFNPSTTFRYSIPTQSKVVIKVYDILGNEIAILMNEEKPAGTYEIAWSAENLPSGVYFYRIQAGSYIESKKMILMK